MTCDVAVVRSAIAADVSLAVIFDLSSPGTAIAAMMLMMVMMIISSMSVNPSSLTDAGLTR